MIGSLKTESVLEKLSVLCDWTNRIQQGAALEEVYKPKRGYFDKQRCIQINKILFIYTRTCQVTLVYPATKSFWWKTNAKDSLLVFPDFRILLKGTFRFF